MKEGWKKFKDRYWPPGKDQLLILVLLGLLLAVIALPAEPHGEGRDGDSGETGAEAADTENMEQGAVRTDYEERLEERLEELLSRVEGVGKVQVMLTFEGSGEKQVEKDETVSGEDRQVETVYEDSGSSVRTPYVTSETNPRVEGVLVIAEGGGSSRVKQEILEAAQALFGIDAHKIKIMKMEGSK